MTNFICLVWFSVRVLCHKELRFTPGGTQKILLPLGSCCASSREESFHRQFSAGSAAVTGRIRSLRFASLEWGASSGQPGSEGMCLLFETSGSRSQTCCISGGHWVNEATAENNDLLHRPAKRKMWIIHFYSLLSNCEDVVVASQLYF